VDNNSVFYMSNLNDNLDPFNASVLLVEDNWAQQKSVKELLRKSQINAAVVCNGEQAVSAVSERMRKNPESPFFKVIVMDYNMPIMTGDISARSIKLISKD